MNKIFMLSFANIRKTKGHTVSLLIMFFISALLLNAGLLVFINFGGFFEKTTKELNTSNMYYIISSSLYNDEVENYIDNNENVLESEKVNSIWANASTSYKGDKREGNFILNDANIIRNMSKWKFIGEHLPADEMSIYVPNIYHLDGGYKLNDKFEMSFKDAKFTFVIKGFIEDVFFSSLETGFMGVYLPHDTYEKVSSQISDGYNSTIIFANLKNVNKDLETGIRKITKAKTVTDSIDMTNLMFSLDLGLIMVSRTMMASIVSIMIVALAIIIVVVCLIVVRFRIGNSIEDDMTKIGSLKAIGYTSKQIVFSIVTQFVLIAFAGSILGISISYLGTPVLSDVFAQQSGLIWKQGFDSVISSISMFIILFIVVIVAYLTARRINKLNPIVALRGGIKTHSFRKNYLPLSTSRGAIPVVLALKSFCQNIKQNVMIAIILLAVSFAGSFAVIMFYNTAVDTRTFAETPGIEISNAIAILNPTIDNTKLINNIKNLNDVRKVQFIDQTTVEIDKNAINVFVMDDYSKKETNTTYQGRYPLHSNEIAIAGHLANMIQKTIGDSVTLKNKNFEAKFLITGLTQGANMGGINASIRSDGLAKINLNHKQQNLQIYLNKGVDAGVFVKSLEKIYGSKLIAAIDADKVMKDGMGAYVEIISKVGITILVVTLAVVILVLYFVISSAVVRRRREMGIQKAIGFTTFQLMNQLSLGFLPPIILGVLVGCVLGITQTNSIMSVAQRSMKVMKANYIITPGSIALFGVAIVVISYLTSMLITYRIRKISAYALVSE